MQNRADRRKYHYIYKITRDDGFYYIGMHSTDDLDDGYFGSGTKILRSVKRHGRERHIKEIVEFLPTRHELRLREEQLVSSTTLADPLCMNIAPGGQKVWVDHPHSELVVETIRKKLRALWADEDRRKRVAEKVASWWTQERREQQSALKKQHNAEPSTIERIAVATKKALSSPNVVQKMSSSKRRNWEDLQYRSTQIASQNRGKQTIQYAEAQRAAKIGERNPNFGTRWIHSPTMQKSTRIMKTEEVPEGWIVGRRIYK